METASFGTTETGDEAQLFTLRTSNGLVVKITNFGAAVTEVHVPDRNGTFADVTLGFHNLTSYLKNDPFFGVVVGRYANRIVKGRFKLGGQTYQLATNNGSNHLHGGIAGFNKKLWNATSFESAEASGVSLHYTSPDGEEGYPGNVHLELTYSLNEANELKIDYRATSDQPTPLNLTNHAYWNLGGEHSGHIGDHLLTIHATHHTPTDSELIPTGEIRLVAGSPLDFRQPKAIGRDINQVGGRPLGYDHNFVLNKSQAGALELAATVTHPTTGRQLDVLTTEPALQFYTGNFLDGTLIGKSGTPYESQHGFCLECQHFPDSPNHPHFPSTILNPGQEYTQTTVHRFSSMA
ncbi:MAG: Aldose 1-epimerase [Verrucomicrobia subdivision 3 bacterium]|nr:Aldose 1-epimerase [Limisphaerales bacterium]MCS1416168.1 Aldose 1-epimerase [Limisphaerales bacterium]